MLHLKFVTLIFLHSQHGEITDGIRIYSNMYKRRGGGPLENLLQPHLCSCFVQIPMTCGQSALYLQPSLIVGFQSYSIWHSHSTYPKSSFFPIEMLFSLIGPESDHWLYLSLTHSQIDDLVGRRLYRCDSFFAQMPNSREGFCKIKMQILPLTFWLPINQYRLSKILSQSQWYSMILLPPQV